MRAGILRMAPIVAFQYAGIRAEIGRVTGAGHRDQRVAQNGLIPGWCGRRHEATFLIAMGDDRLFRVIVLGGLSLVGSSACGRAITRVPTWGSNDAEVQLVAIA
jgi:hypothetical protein